MSAHPLSLTLQSPDETADFAASLSRGLMPGDVVLLSGDVGAGKTHLARSLIQTLTGTAEDVPSPTFTLVQTYDSPRGEIWHADLYRLTSVYEVEELGLIDAFETAICLVEWPDRLGALAPENALSILLEHQSADNTRAMMLFWKNARWDDRLAGWRK